MIDIPATPKFWVLRDVTVRGRFHTEPDSSPVKKAELDTLRIAVCEILRIDESLLSEETDLLATGRMDSLSVVTLLSRIESSFGVRIPDALIVPERFQSLIALHDLITEARASPQA